jgi:hypothetical protein
MQYITKLVTSQSQKTQSPPPPKYNIMYHVLYLVLRQRDIIQPRIRILHFRGNADPDADPVGASALSTENIQTLQNTVLWIRVGFNADTDPAFWVNAAPDGDPDPVLVPNTGF